MDKNEIRETCLRVMKESEVAVLATVDAEGFPQTRAMVNLRRESQFPDLADFFENECGGFTTYFATGASSNKVNQIRSNPKVTVFFCKPMDGLTLGGRIEIVEDEGIKKRLYQDVWNGYYPQGHEDPEYIVLRLEPFVVRGWFHGNAFEFEPEDEL
ncbi:pyridoxamine 5'-phosphate oxidase family protein [Candidatus Hydrogenedentota bacterium]